MEAMNMKTLEGQLTAQGMKVAIVVARFNEFDFYISCSSCSVYAHDLRAAHAPFFPL